jgi:hypothetical protein
MNAIMPSKSEKNLPLTFKRIVRETAIYYSMIGEMKRCSRSSYRSYVGHIDNIVY